MRDIDNKVKDIIIQSVLNPKTAETGINKSDVFKKALILLMIMPRKTLISVIRQMKRNNWY